MDIHTKIKEELKEAMKAREATRVSVIRSMLAAFTNELVAKKRTPQETLADDEVRAVIKRLAKQRKESAEQFRGGDREELAKKEESELEILERYLPQIMNKEGIERVVEAKKRALGVTDKSGSGKLIGAVMAELKEKADGGDVKVVVEEMLGTTP